MRDADMVVLEKVLHALEWYLPIKESRLFAEYLATYEYLSGKLEKRRASYQKKAQYHRDKSRQWRQENPEQAKKHIADWQARQKQKKEVNKT